MKNLMRFPVLLLLLFTSLVAIWLIQDSPSAKASSTSNTQSTNAKPSMASANYALTWTAIGEVSGGSSTSASYKLDATISQMAVQTESASANFKACTGFQCALIDLLRKLFLPLILK